MTRADPGGGQGSKVTPQAIWDELIRQGASTDEAAGIMGNMINESGLNPEAVNPAGPESGVGLVQWQTTDYPGAATLVTGSPFADMVAQIRFLAMTHGFRAAAGASPAAAGGNFAARYEKCAGCQPGGAQFSQRAANARMVAGWAQSGKWPKSAGVPSGTGGGTQAALTAAEGAAAASDCLYGLTWGTIPGVSWVSGFVHAITFGMVGGGVSQGYAVCLLHKSQARALIGTGLMLAGGMVGFAGLAVFMAAAGMKVAGSLGKAAEGVGGALMFVPGAEGAGVAIAGAGKAARNPAQAGRRRRARQVREENAQRRRLGEPRENRELRVGRGTVREAPEETRRRRASSRASQADKPPF